MKISLKFILVTSILLFSFPSFASYLIIPANTGTVDEDYDDCNFSYDGTVTSTSTTACILYFPITVPSGNTFSSATVYYYDNSGSQFALGGLYAEYHSSDLTSTYDTFTDTTTSASIQNSVLSYTTTMTTSYAYYVIVSINYGTKLRGIKLYYY